MNAKYQPYSMSRNLDIHFPTLTPHNPDLHSDAFASDYSTIQSLSFFFRSRALHMKEHPDYKYRPRRKPKSVIKKENKFGFSLSPLAMSSSEHHNTLNSISRGLLPPLGPPGINHPLISHEDLKIPRFFPPFPYPLYPIQHKMGEDFGGGKLAADLAFQAIYGSGGSFYSGHQVAWPGLTTPSCLQVGWCQIRWI